MTELEKAAYEWSPGDDDFYDIEDMKRTFKTGKI